MLVYIISIIVTTYQNLPFMVASIFLLYLVCKHGLAAKINAMNNLTYLCCFMFVNNTGTIRENNLTKENSISMKIFSLIIPSSLNRQRPSTNVICKCYQVMSKQLLFAIDCSKYLLDS